MRYDLTMANHIAWGGDESSSGVQIVVTCPFCNGTAWILHENQNMRFRTCSHYYVIRECCRCGSVIETNAIVRKIGNGIREDV
jgi:hypothetical protein